MPACKAMKVSLLAPLCLALMLRVVLLIATNHFTGTGAITQGDTESYVKPALSLFQQGTFASDNIPEIDRTPGYPVFLFLCGIAGNHVLLAVAAQVFVSLASTWLVWRIAGRIYPQDRAQSIAAWLFAIEPASLLYTIRLMPETLFVFLLLLAIDRFIEFLTKSGLSSIFAAGLCLAAATYVRPVGYYLVLPLAVAMAFVPGRTAKDRWKASVLLLLTVVPLLALWQVRNATVSGYTGFSSIVEKNLYFFQAAEVTAELEHRSLDAEQKVLGYPDRSAYLAAHPEQTSWTIPQRLHFMRAEATQTISEHRALYLRTHFAGVAVVAFTPCASEWFQLLGIYPDPRSMPRRILNEGILTSLLIVAGNHPGILAWMCILECFLLALYILALKGTQNDAMNRLPMYLLIGVSLYFLIISGGAQAVGRYRLPIMPIVCIFAAGGLTEVKKNRAGRVLISTSPNKQTRS